MPELPEVQHAADSLGLQVVGQSISHVLKLDWERMVETPAVADFVALLAGREIRAVWRRAKWIILDLDGGWHLALHLRMSGHMTVEKVASEPGTYVHFALELADRRRIFFHDTRKFGRARLLDAAGLAALDRAHGIEPFAEDFTPATLAALLQRSARQIKPLLLDQALIAGIGNIYADESLWLAQIQPTRVAHSLSTQETNQLHAAIRTALTSGLRNGGSTLRDYRNAYGETGTNQQHFHAYGRTGEPCGRCGAPIIRIVVGQRGTHYCAECQF
jgi:formamidopyrimidine-DNA glycosylase